MRVRSVVGWDVTRTGRTVRIDIVAEVDMSEEATTAILAAAMEHLLDDDVSVVQVDGSALDPDLPDLPIGLAATVTELELLADRYGKRLMVGPT